MRRLKLIYFFWSGCLFRSLPRPSRYLCAAARRERLQRVEPARCSSGSALTSCCGIRWPWTARGWAALHLCWTHRGTPGCESWWRAARSTALWPLGLPGATQVNKENALKKKKRVLCFISVWKNFLVFSEGCKPKSVGLEGGDDFKKPQNNNSSQTNSTEVSNHFSSANKSSGLPSSLMMSACVWSVPVLYEEVDVLSLRFTATNGPNVSVTDAHPTLLTYPLQTQATGGTLNLRLTLNTVSLSFCTCSVRSGRTEGWTPSIFFFLLP